MSRARWLYDPFEERLFREDASGRHEVPLSPQQHRLVAFMAERNRLSGDKHVLCGREELIQAVWGDEQGHTPQDLAYLVHQLRARLGGGAEEPLPILSERGRGYRLALDPPASHASNADRAAGLAQVPAADLDALQELGLLQWFNARSSTTPFKEDPRPLFKLLLMSGRIDYFWVAAVGNWRELVGPEISAKVDAIAERAVKSGPFNGSRAA